ncbi:MAG: hypothetical protein JOZ13_10195 [Alphaproteobacteria bacterium]|nr:hypothetical protein [Alphaproteobacteria bacterium]
MTKLVWTRDEILADHLYAKPHLEAGYRLHGGFDGEGRYVSPRTLNRWPAIRAWEQALKARGHDIVDGSRTLLARGSFPNVAQQSFLLAQGFGETLWNSLSVTGVVEARGRMLAEAEAPDFQSAIDDDISATAVGHLNKGLVRAHGLDEGGDGVLGGHDAMWFAVRDMLFGKHAYPHAQVPESLARPETGRLMPQLAPEHERWILLLMNVLMIEVRAERFFNFCTDVMRAPQNFADRRAVALHAADLVDRIRQDEAPHVGYLTVAISEMRGFVWRGANGGKIKGAEFIDPVWRGMVHWHAVANADFECARAAREFDAMLRARPDGEALVRRFHDLSQKEAA